MHPDRALEPGWKAAAECNPARRGVPDSRPAAMFCRELGGKCASPRTACVRLCTRVITGRCEPAEPSVAALPSRARRRGDAGCGPDRPETLSFATPWPHRDRVAIVPGWRVTLSIAAAPTHNADAFLPRLNAVAADIEALLDRLLAARSRSTARSPGRRGCSTPCAMRASAAASACGPFWWWRPPPCSTCRASAPSWSGRRSNACTAIRWPMTICPPWTMTRCGAASRPPTRQFDEATAILAGDGLLTYAFDILARAETHPNACGAGGAGAGAGARLRSRRHGGRPDARSRGGRPVRRRRSRSTTPRSTTLQAMKTGALLRFGCIAGALLGEANGAQHEALDRYGSALGRAFQIADDLLDVEGDAAMVGQVDRQGCGRRKGDPGGHARARARQGAARGPGRRGGGRARAFGAGAALLKAAARFVAERRA